MINYFNQTYKALTFKKIKTFKKEVNPVDFNSLDKHQKHSLINSFLEWYKTKNYKFVITYFLAELFFSNY